MNEQQNNEITAGVANNIDAQQTQEEQSISLVEIWGMFVPYWKTFLLSVAVCLVIAFFYLKKTSPVYTRSMSVLIKDDSKNGSGGASNAMSQLSTFSDLGLFNSSVNIKNELSTITSPVLIEKVVRKLNLNQSYVVKKGLRSVDIYKKSPLKVVFYRDRDNSSCRFDIDLTSDAHYKLSNFCLDGEELDGEVEGDIFTPIKTPVGYLTIFPTTEGRKDFIDKTIHFSKNTIAGTVTSVGTNLTGALADKESTIINLDYKDSNVRRAIDVLNALIEMYNRNWIEDKNQVAVSTSQFIDGRLTVIEHELGNVDNNISSYKSKNLIPDVQAASQLFMTNASETKTKAFETTNQLSIAQFIRSYLKKNRNQPLPANSGIENTGVESQIADYNKMLLERNTLLSNSGENNPLVKDLNRSISSMYSAIVHSVDNLIVSLGTQLRGFQTNESEMTQQIASSPKQARYLLSIERQQKVKEQLYLYLLQKREENQLSQAFTAYNTRVIAKPNGSKDPTSPKTQIIYLAAFILGLALPAGIIYLRNIMDTAIHGRKDIDKLSVPFAGEVPQSYDDAERKRRKTLLNWWRTPEIRDTGIKIVVKEMSRNSINEAFRILRTNVSFLTANSKEEGGRVLMLTSFNPNSGKTFIALNLALTLAIRRRVVIVDLDLRKASLSTSIHSPKQGVSNYLGRQTDDWKSLVVKGKLHKNLDVLPVGTIPPNPTELLSDNRLTELLEQLRAEYDYVFLDCPPTNIVADTSIVAKEADSTLFIIRCGLLDRRMVPELDNIYKSGQFNHMSLILNGVDYDSNRYGYHKYGYYGSYYGGYGRYGTYGHHYGGDYYTDEKS